jgi:hypothetical protein
MSPDPHEPDLGPELTPAEEQVRRLLADARHTEPMPEDVAARLDGVLADLAAEDGAGRRRVSDHSVARAADLAAARRRRTARNLLIAAAAVVAIGVGINQADLTITSNNADADSMSSGGDAAAEAAPSTAGGREGATQDEAPQAVKPGKTGLDYGLHGAYQAGAVRLSADRFGTQVRRLQADAKMITMQDRNDAASEAATDGLFSLGQALRPGCSTQGWGAGLLVPVRYDGDLGGLVFRTARGETQVVDLFLCGTDEPTRSITLSAR